MGYEKLPYEVLKKAIQLRNSQKRVFVALYNYGKPATAQEIAQTLQMTRPNVFLRLQELVDLGFVIMHREGRKGVYEVA